MSAEQIPDGDEQRPRGFLGRIVPVKAKAPAERPDALPSVPDTGERIAIATEFQPDAVEIEERSPPKLTRYMLYTSITMFVLLILWASLATMDRVVSGVGKLVTNSPHVVLQPLETSIIKSMNVRPGQTVKQGEVLATLDSTFTSADLADLKSRASSFGAEIARLRAELEETPFVIPSRPTPDELLQFDLYERRRASYQAQLSGYSEEIRKAQASLASARSDIAALTERLAVITEIEKMRRELAQKEVGSRLQLLVAQNERLSVNGNLDRARNALTEAQATIESTTQRREAFVQQRRQEIAAELVQRQRQANEVNEQLNKAELRQSLVTLSAPRDSIVLETIDRTVGAVVRQGDALVTLIPVDAPLEVEVRIPLADIGFLTVGQPVRVKLHAFPFQKHGTLDGVLKTISEDAFTDRNKPDIQFYQATVQLTTTELRNVPDTFRLIPGMTTTAEVKVGDRKVISYFLYPVLGAVDQAFKDPGR